MTGFEPATFQKRTFCAVFQNVFQKKLRVRIPLKLKYLPSKMHNFPLQILFKMTPLNHFQLKITSDKAECVKCHHY